MNGRYPGSRISKNLPDYISGKEIMETITVWTELTVAGSALAFNQFPFSFAWQNQITF
tara:strand:- start:221 stop:394 length:174 start_codon:yes stop_codon:yes gene_type:complete